MNFQHRYSPSVIVVTVAMFIILPLLAYLQYTWLGQLSEQEYKRMQNNVRTAAMHCSMDFDQEINNMLQSLGGDLQGSDKKIENTLGVRIKQWKATAAHPAIISDTISFPAYPSDDKTILIHVNEQSSILLFKDFSAIAFPIQGKSHKAISVTLDRQYMSSSLIPEIIQAHFPSSMRADYDYKITDNAGNLFFGSTDTVVGDFQKTADVIVPFLALLSTPFSFEPPGRPRHDDIAPNEHDRHRPFERMLQEQNRRREFSSRRETLPPRDRDHEMRWSGLYELRIKHRDGSLEAAVNKNRLRNLGMSFGVLLLLGVSIGFLLISANRAQRLAQQQLEFVAGVSHELRTPLAVLKSAGENLADGVIQEKARTRQYGELINNEVIRLSEMVEKALAYAGIQSGKRVYEFHPVDISAVMKAAIHKAKKVVPKNNLTIEISIDQQLPRVMGQAEALQSACENLIINAIKYSSTKNWVKVEGRTVLNSHESYIEIIVTDRGIGIPPNDLPNIFKPFYRGRNAIDNQIHGSGLGLSITKHIIEAHQGTISVKSTANEGSVFTMRLPIAMQTGRKQ
jgi:signal transduction histidine kinase